MGTESKELHHKDEGCSIDNVAKVADNVVDIFKDSPRPRTAKVAIALQGWKMKSVGNQKWTTLPSDLSPSPLSPAWKPFGQMGWGRKLPGEEPNKDKPEIMFWNMLFRRIHPCLTLLILPWTSVCGARSRLTSWPGWSRAHLYCLLRSWNKHTLWNYQNNKILIQLIQKGSDWNYNAECCYFLPVNQEFVSIPCVLHQSFCDL